MYEYAPHYSKRKETLLTIVLSVTAVLLLICARIPQMPLPALWQAVAILAISAAVLLSVRFLMRKYVYRVEAVDGAGPDLVIVEYTGKRERVVCRVAIAQIRSVILLTEENRKEEKKKRRGTTAWLYYAEMEAQDLFQLEIEMPHERFFVLLQADQMLQKYLQSL